MKNNLSDLNNHLFAMLEELGDGDSSEDSGRLDQLLKRARSMCDVSSQILRVADMQVKAVRMAEGFGMSNEELLRKVDCGFFWSLFKDAQRDAFGAGKLNAGESLPEPEKEEAPKKAAQPLEPGEYTLPQLAELTGKPLATIKLYLKRWGVEARRIPIRTKADPRVAYRLTEAQLDEIRAARTRGTATGSKDSGHPLPGTAEEVPGDSGEPGEAGASGGGPGGQGRGCSGTDPDGNDHYWGSLREASEESRIKESTIRWAAAKGRTVQGWTFWYFE